MRQGLKCPHCKRGAQAWVAVEMDFFLNSASEPAWKNKLRPVYWGRGCCRPCSAEPSSCKIPGLGLLSPEHQAGNRGWSGHWLASRSEVGIPNADLEILTQKPSPVTWEACELQQARRPCCDDSPYLGELQEVNNPGN